MKCTPENLQPSLLMEFRRAGENCVSERDKNVSLDMRQKCEGFGFGFCVGFFSFFLFLWGKIVCKVKLPHRNYTPQTKLFGVILLSFL